MESRKIQTADSGVMRTWSRRIQMLAVSFLAVAAVPSNGTAVQKAIYQKRCAPCHGPGGMGDGPSAAKLQPPPRPFSGGLKGRNDPWIAKIIKGGGPAVGLPPTMPAYPSLNDDQVKALVQYVKGLGH
jgi:mono/diheme cytochrome c family protein